MFSEVFVIIVVMELLRIIGAFVAYRKYFENRKEVLLFAFSHSMPLTFLVATAQLGKQFGAISAEEYYAFIIAALLEGILLTICIKLISNYKAKDSTSFA